MSVSSRALNLLAESLRRHRNEIGSRWRKLSAGRQAPLTLAHLRKSETYSDLACGFGVGTSTVYRYLHEAIGLLAAMVPTLDQAIEVARGKAFVILDGTCCASTGSAWPRVEIGRSTAAGKRPTA